MKWNHRSSVRCWLEIWIFYYLSDWTVLQCATVNTTMIPQDLFKVDLKIQGVDYSGPLWAIENVYKITAQRVRTWTRCRLFGPALSNWKCVQITSQRIRTWLCRVYCNFAWPTRHHHYSIPYRMYFFTECTTARTKEGRTHQNPMIERLA